jgi:hypothetical protein
MKTKNSVSLLIAFAGLAAIGTLVTLLVSAQLPVENRQEKSPFPPVTTLFLEEQEWRQPLPPPALVAQSDLIAIGTVVSRGRASSSEDGNRVATVFDVQLMEVLKSKRPVGSSTTITFPGGLANQPDGSLLVVRARGVRLLGYGKTYLMFLTRAQEGSKGDFRVLRGSQGLYEIPADSNTLIHYGSPVSGPEKQTPIDKDAFIREVRKLLESRL